MEYAKQCTTSRDTWKVHFESRLSGILMFPRHSFVINTHTQTHARALTSVSADLVFIILPGVVGALKAVLSEPKPRGGRQC